MNQNVDDPLAAKRNRGKTITLAVLLVWVAAVFTYSILRFARVIT